MTAEVYTERKRVAKLVALGSTALSGLIATVAAVLALIA
jgi:hypothetical protein